MWSDGYRDQIVTMLHSVMWVCLCIPGHIHCSCSTVMALLCLPLSELVSFACSTIPILIQRIFSFTCYCRDCHGVCILSIHLEIKFLL